jgi:GPCR-Autoproteolysis INducing (GAIN) domain/GPCR proteolysis site, GPS, motif
MTNSYFVFCSVMAISVLSLRSLSANGTSFPPSSYEEPYGTIADSVLLPRQLLAPEASPYGLVKVVFFSFKHLDEILAQFFHQRTTAGASPPRILNSRIISAAIVRHNAAGGATIVASSPPVAAQIVLRHLRLPAAAPTCVIWDTAAAAWSEAGCRVVAARANDTLCECYVQQGGVAHHFGLLMDEVGEEGEGGGLVTTVVQLPAFHVEIIAASVAAGILLILILLLLKVSLKQRS